MKTLLKIAITLSVFGFALTSNAQGFEMLDIVKVMDKPAKQKASGKKSRGAKNSGSDVRVVSAITAEKNYRSKVTDVDGAIQTEVSAENKPLNILPNTGPGEISSKAQQGELQHYSKRMVPAIANPKLHRIIPSGRVD